MYKPMKHSCSCPLCLRGWPWISLNHAYQLSQVCFGCWGRHTYLIKRWREWIQDWYWAFHKHSEVRSMTQSLIRDWGTKINHRIYKVYKETKLYLHTSTPSMSLWNIHPVVQWLRRWPWTSSIHAYKLSQVGSSCRGWCTYLINW